MKQYSFTQASEKAGLLYGNLLGRSADKEGYDQIVEVLQAGNSSVRDIVKSMLTSEEFRESFLMNNTPNELAKILRTVLLKEFRPKPDAIKETAVQLLQNDWRVVVADLVESEAYGKVYGNEKIPTIRHS